LKAVPFGQHLYRPSYVDTTKSSGA
jgi:hypothetical protein